ncbi:unnamed protein product [Prunus armeniaca]|uniref:Uncharacterized protein n=2 Tax=Prunus armeniaca TaxID=36596 RepID=A0A6J5WEV3_PRUAR|nr:unnamed protein product [Prunus armeniaca]
MEAELQCSNGIQSMERKLRIACHASDANIDNVLKDCKRNAYMEAELQCSNGIQSMERKLRIACHASDANIDNVLKVNNSGLPPMFDGAALEGLNLSISGAHSKVALLEASKSK